MMLLVTGASGVGKSTVRALIAEERHRLEVIDVGWDEMRWERLPDAWEVPLIDNTEMSPAEAAAEAVAWCRSVIAGG
jgi:predicted ABC-type ATPase